MSALSPLHLRLCPTCEGRRELEPGGACPQCGGAGVLDAADQPFRAPHPFEHLSPAELVDLDTAARERDRRGGPTTRERWRMTRTLSGEPAAVRERPRKLSLSEILELMLTRQSTEHSTVRLTRNAKGDTQIEVAVRTGEPGIDTIEQAHQRATAVYDHLRGLYPISTP